MSIEFRCTNCDKLLRTPDATAGKQAKCPACGKIAIIPAESTATAGPAMPPPASQSPFGPPPQGVPAIPPPQPSPNPYQAPAPYAAGFPPPPADPMALRPTPLDIGQVFSRAWNIYRDNLGVLLAGSLILSCGIFAIASAMQVVAMVLAHAAGSEEVAGMAFVGLAMLLLPVTAWLVAGQTLLFLKVARGQPASVGDIFRGGPWTLNMMGAGFLFLIAVYAGTMLCIVPGVILALMFSQFTYLIVDRNAGVLESLSLSTRIMEGNKAMLFVLLLLQGLINNVGMLACGVGMLFTIPFVVMMNAVAYLMISGQPTAGVAYGYAPYGVPQPTPLPNAPYPPHGQSPFGPGNPPV